MSSQDTNFSLLKLQKIKKTISKFPDSPGVYFFKRGKKILYVGKATSLRDRVRSYFSADIVNTRSPLISKMMAEFDSVTFEKTDSVLEALILEALYIKKLEPGANIKDKDNRSFNYVVITKEDFPRILVVRGRELELEVNKDLYEISYKFGPFPNGGQLREALKIVRKLFPYRDKCLPCDLNKMNKCKPCFNRQIGLCPGVCSGEISKNEYAKTIKNIILFFEAKKKVLVKSLQKQMKDFAKVREFEKANKIKRTLFTLNHIQDISIIKENLEEKENREKAFRIESYDIAHMSGKNVVGVMTVVENGEAKLSDYRKFIIRENPGVNDTKALSEVLTRRLNHIEWTMPDLIVVDGGVAQRNIMEKILKTNGADIPVVSVVKDERHKPKEILGDKKWLIYEREILLSNSEAHRYAIAFHTKLRNKILR